MDRVSTIRRGCALGAMAVAALAAGCASAPTAPAAASPLVGTWRLVSFEMEVQATGERIQPMGRQPAGYLSFQPEGRMSVVITAETRRAGGAEHERAALYSTMVAYAGRFRTEGDKWITTVDAAWNPAWVGTEQPRAFRISGDTLREESTWFPRTDLSMARVINTYARVK